MKPRPIAILWPDEQNFARFREVCGDIQSQTLNAYLAAIAVDIKAKESRGIIFERIEFDPDDLLAFAKAAGFDRAVSQVRAGFAVTLQQKRHRTD